MSKKSSERRMVENEAVFRKFNQHVEHGFKELQKLAKAEGEAQPDIDMPMHFFCECSDENCRLRIMVSLDEYRRIHTSKKRFFVIPGHETALCEFVIETTPHYTIVQKYMMPPNSALSLNATTVNNS